jgi:hypothetical protein
MAADADDKPLAARTIGYFGEVLKTPPTVAMPNRLVNYIQNISDHKLTWIAPEIPRRTAG